MTHPNQRPDRALTWAAAIALTVQIAGCGGVVRPEITAGIDGCAECGMVIDQLNQACGWVEGGEFEPFCSPGCLLSRWDENRAAGAPTPSPVYFADFSGSGFSPAETTVFLLTDHIPTVMNAAVVTFRSKTDAEAARRHDDEIVTDWVGYRVRRGRPDSIVETTFTPDGMVPQSVTVAKGDIVLWRAVAGNLEADLNFGITGYPEVGTATVSTGGDAIEFRFLATRPGAGFPIEGAGSGEVLGMLKVTGAHTADEAAQ